MALLRLLINISAAYESHCRKPALLWSSDAKGTHHVNVVAVQLESVSWMLSDCLILNPEDQLLRIRLTVWGR